MRISSPFKSIPGVVTAAVVAAGLVTAGLGYKTFDLVHHELERELDHRIEIDTAALLATYTEQGLRGLVREVNERDRRLVPGHVGYLVGMRNENRMMAAFIVDAAGKRIAGSIDADTPPPGWTEFVRIRRANGSVGVAQGMNSALNDGNQLVVLADRAILEEVGATLKQLFIFGLGLTLLVCAAAAFGVGRFVQIRLGTIQTTAEAIMAGDLQRRIPRDHSASEFDRLSAVLNNMLDRISALLLNLKQVSENIAHDMRTPLNRVRQQIENAERHERDQGQRVRLREALADMDELLDLFSGLLAISEIEGFRVRDRFAQINLGEATREVVEAYLPAMTQANIEVEQQIAEIDAHGDKRLLQQCVANLLDNVLVHAKGATRVQVAVAKYDSCAAIRVRDNGPGIDTQHQVRIFDRLVRLDDARSTPGNGLGLSLVAAIAAAHHGGVRTTQVRNGLEVEVTLPLL